tara:strand:+ start:6538 stop:6708 length:171 start_codon:yes stop_codon:yes gene_type:complete
MNFQKGDLVCHSIKHLKLLGIVVKKDKIHDEFYKIFWYNTGKVQSIHKKFIEYYED